MIKHTYSHHERKWSKHTAADAPIPTVFRNETSPKEAEMICQGYHSEPQQLSSSFDASVLPSRRKWLYQQYPSESFLYAAMALSTVSIVRDLEGVHLDWSFHILTCAAVAMSILLRKTQR